MTLFARSADGTLIAHEVLGEGPPVLLVGGAFNDRHARTSGTPLARLLAPGLRAITLDRRGRGESGDTTPWSIDREIDDLAAVIAACGGQAAVYGMSSGAMLALAAAARGVPITSLVLYEPPLCLDPSRTTEQQSVLTAIERALAAGRPGDAAESFLGRSVGVPAPMLAGMKSAPMWRALEAFAPTLPRDMRLALHTEALFTQAPSIATRALLVRGDRTPSWLAAGLDAFARSMPDARTLVLEGQSHDVDIAVLARPLAEFVAA